MSREQGVTWVAPRWSLSSARIDTSSGAHPHTSRARGTRGVGVLKSPRAPQYSVIPHESEREKKRRGLATPQLWGDGKTWERDDRTISPEKERGREIARERSAGIRGARSPGHGNAIGVNAGGQQREDWRDPYGAPPLPSPVARSPEDQFTTRGGASSSSPRWRELLLSTQGGECYSPPLAPVVTTGHHEPCAAGSGGKHTNSSVSASSGGKMPELRGNPRVRFLNTLSPTVPRRWAIMRARRADWRRNANPGGVERDAFSDAAERERQSYRHEPFRARLPVPSLHPAPAL